MAIEPVCAVIVSHHPHSGMVENFSKIIAQVAELVVVDNASAPDELQNLQNAGKTFGYQLIENRDNLGIAEALNQGVRWAKSRSYRWVIFFDQDSTITDDFVSKMLGVWETYPDRERVASIHPKYIDPVTGVEPFVRRAKDGGPIVSMTSGALMPTWIFDKIGWFASEYFIDCVDFEYCLRIRAAGFLVIDSRQAVLSHAPGQAERPQTFWGMSFRLTHHSVTRRYYISRNRVALYKRYFHVFPGWVLQSMLDAVRETIKCFIGDKHRASKFRSFLLGTWDGLTGKMGKLDTESDSH